LNGKEREKQRVKKTHSQPAPKMRDRRRPGMFDPGVSDGVLSGDDGRGCCAGRGWSGNGNGGGWAGGGWCSNDGGGTKP
jgi:hypothetical protein